MLLGNVALYMVNDSTAVWAFHLSNFLALVQLLGAGQASCDFAATRSGNDCLVTEADEAFVGVFIILVVGLIFSTK